MTSVRDVMTAEPLCAEVPGSRKDLVDLFVKHSFAGFPVVKRGSKKLVGLVTRREVLAEPDEDQVALLMNPNPFTTYPGAHVREAARIIQGNHLRTLPVVSSDNDVVGVVTPPDLLAVLTRQKGFVSSYLHGRAVPCYAGTPAPVALEILRAARTTALPVLDDRGRLCGILTDHDLLARAQVTDAVVKTVAGTSGDSDEWTWEGIRDVRSVEHATRRMDLPRRPISEIMVTSVATARPNTSVADAARRMRDLRVSQLPVVDEEQRLLDVLTDVDLVGALL